MKEFEGLEKKFHYQGASVSFTADFDLLPEVTKSTVEPQLIEAAAMGFKRPVTPEFSADVKNHLRGGDLYIVEQSGSISGFAMLEKFSEYEVIYIAGIVKKLNAPSRIIEKVIEYHLDNTGLGIVVVRTQNDRVLEILANTCSNVAAMDRMATPSEVDLLLKMDLVTPKSDLDRDYLIHRGYYGSPMIQDGIRRRSANIKVRNLTDRLRYFQGDATYGIGYRRNRI